VLVFDEKGQPVLANGAAVTLLGDERSMPLPAWNLKRGLADRLSEVMAVASGSATFEWRDEESGKTFVVHVAPMVAQRKGWVVVIDDVSDVVLAQRLAAWGEIARRLAHEIKNPLTPIRLAAERLRYKLAEKLPERERQLLERATETITAQVDAMTEMVNAFRDYARLPGGKRERVDLAALVRSLLVFYEESPIALECQIEGEGPWLIEGDTGQLRQVLHNLLQNAQDALEGVEAPRIVLRLQRQGEQIIVSVCDNGVGFPEGYQHRAFEPYYTTKKKGTGLGLAVVKKIADDHRATVTLGANEEGRGAVVTLTFSAAQNA
jgi:nitrogen fixation/metabolism regulation signal transduction histidine kinase